MPDPILISVGPFAIRWYGVLIATAILVGTLLALREVRKKNINEDHFLNVLIAGIPAGIIGARLYYVIFNWDYYGQFPREIPAIWNGGLAIHGGIIGSFAAAWFVVKYYQINFWEIADAVAPSMILGQAIGRWGNYFNQEAYGYEVDPVQIPWAMYIDGAWRHPTFLYESVWNLLVFGLLLFLRSRYHRLPTGGLFAIYIGAYSVGRFFIEGFRTDSLMLGPLRMAQVTSLSFLLLSAALLWYLGRQEGRQQQKNGGHQ